MTYEELTKKVETLLDGRSALDVDVSPDFQSDQTRGYPASLCVLWDKGKAWLEPNEMLAEDDTDLSCARQGCAEKLTVLPDGSIPQAEVTSCGLNGGPLPGTGTYEARIACNLSGKKGTCKSDEARKVDKNNDLPYFTQSGEDREANGDQYIANLKDGAWCGFKYFAFDAESQGLTITIRGTGRGQLQVYTDRAKAPVAQIDVAPSEDWTVFSGPLSVPTGTWPLYFVFAGEGAVDFLRFELQ